MDDNTVKMPRFACAYPEVSKACARLEIYTLPELLARVRAAVEAAAMAGLWQGQTKAFNKENLHNMLKSKPNSSPESYGLINPWDSDRQSFCPLAVFVGLALRRFPTYLFGSPKDLEILNRKVYEMPTPQRDHIRALMREAHNPLTGKKGISRRDFIELSLQKGQWEHNPLEGSNFPARLDAGTGTAKNNYPIAFLLPSGAPTPWALECAAILNQTVEEIFRFSAAKHEARSGLYLPMRETQPLEAVQNRPSLYAGDNPEDRIFRSEMVSFLRAAISEVRLTAKQKEVLALRFLDELSPKETAERMGTTRQAVHEKEIRAIYLLGRYMRKKGFTGNSLLPG